jgi:hypothetical protein
LELGVWSFSGVWSLVFGVSIPGFLWCLELGFWCFDSGISLGLGVRRGKQQQATCSQSDNEQGTLNNLFKKGSFAV